MPAKTIPMRRWLAAASVLLLPGLGNYFFFVINDSQLHDRLHPIVATHDVQAPTTSKATMTLSDGSIVLLDSVAAGNTISDNGVRMMRSAEGQLLYDGTERTSSSEEVAEVYNALTNPRGSQVIHVILGDGSRVWLNAGSSVTYPVALPAKKENRYQTSLSSGTVRTETATDVLSF